MKISFEFEAEDIEKVMKDFLEVWTECCKVYQEMIDNLFSWRRE
jgi:uncharacterized metal-binding protein